MDKLEALAALEEGDHAIFYVEDGQKIAAAFGIEAPVRTFTAGEDRVATMKGGSGEGVDAADLACKIADSLGLDYPRPMGIGSRLRAACKAIRASLACPQRP